MNHQVLKLLDKKRKSVEDHLSDHIDRDQINQSYKTFRPKGITETNHQYVERLRKENSSYQFVAVNYRGKIQYIAFGVPGPIISKEGRFEAIPAQVVGGQWGIHHILFYPGLQDVLARKEVFIRIDSGCFSGMVLGDETCDCKSQLDMAKQQCVQQGTGMVIEIPGHDGRGWGEYKMANQRLMEELDMTTVEAARAFYEDETLIDQRTYIESVLILLAFGFQSEYHAFQLATNNPMKIQAFEECNLKLLDPSPVVAEHPNACVVRNLRAKHQEWNHTVSFV